MKFLGGLIFITGLLWGLILIIKDTIKQSKRRKEMYEEIFMKADYQGGNNDSK